VFEWGCVGTATMGEPTPRAPSVAPGPSSGSRHPRHPRSGCRESRDRPEGAAEMGCDGETRTSLRHPVWIGAGRTRTRQLSGGVHSSIQLLRPVSDGNGE
jgi:hypothetical protein